MLRGFDASSVQGKLPFAKLDPALRFVILKAQQGNDGFDPDFVENVRGAEAVGLVPFAYCFGYPLPEDPKHPGRAACDQAALFVERIRAVAPELLKRPLFLDFEWPEPQDWTAKGVTAASISLWCQACAEEVQRLTGIAPIIYTYPDWWAHVSVADVLWAAAFSLWLAAYVASCPKPGDSPHVPRPWTSWLFWQWDGNGGQKLPNGVDADFVVFNGDEDALQALLQSSPSPSAPPDFDTAHPGVELDPPAPPSDG